MPSRDFVAFDPLTILSELRDVEYLVVGRARTEGKRSRTRIARGDEGAW